MIWVDGNLTSLDVRVKGRGRLIEQRDARVGEASFAAGLNPYKLIWIFIVGCVIGSVFERFFICFAFGSWERRSGMLIGDFNQIYGLGAVLFVLAAHFLQNRSKWRTFFTISVVGGAYELVCGSIQMALFNSMSWDYSSYPGCIGPHANVFVAMGWGLMGVLFITFALPPLSEMLERIPNAVTILRRRIPVGRPLTLLFAVFLALNLGLTCMAQARAGERNRGIPAEGAVSQWLDETYPDEVMKERFPNMDFSPLSDEGGEK